MNRVECGEERVVARIGFKTGAQHCRRAHIYVAEPCCSSEVLVLKHVRKNEWYFPMEKFTKADEIARKERKKHEGMRAKECGSGKSTTKN